MLIIQTKLPDQSPQVAEDEVALDFDLRQKSRLRVTLRSGREAALKMARGSILRGGDYVQSDCGVIIKVIAAPQLMMKVTAHTPLALNRAAYHLGNRHVPLQIGDGWLLLEQDSVLKEMLLGLGVEVSDLQAPFEPESGAYGGGHHHAADSETADHQHSHDHGHVHSHSHDHTH